MAIMTFQMKMETWLHSPLMMSWWWDWPAWRTPPSVSSSKVQTPQGAPFCPGVVSDQKGEPGPGIFWHKLHFHHYIWQFGSLSKLVVKIESRYLFKKKKWSRGLSWDQAAERVVCFSDLFQRRRSTAETFLFMLSLHLPLATILLPHLELIIPHRPQWPPGRSCTLTSPVTAVRDLWLERASSVRFAQTTIFARPARLEGRTPSMPCCPFGTRCRWGASREVVYFGV